MQREKKRFNSMKIKKKQKGVALIEVILVITILIPMVLSASGAMQYATRYQKVIKIIEEKTRSLNIKPFSMNTGYIGYFLSSKARYGCENESTKECKNSPRSEWEKEVRAYLDEVESAVINSLECSTNCKEKYRIEFRAAFIRINKETGRAERIASCENPRFTEWEGYTNGSIKGCPFGQLIQYEDDTSNPYVKVRGNFVNKKEYNVPYAYQDSIPPYYSGFLREKMIEYLDKSPTPFEFALPAGLRGVDVADYYSSADVHNKERNYLRSSVIYGLLIEADLSENLLANIFNKIQRDDEDKFSIRAYQITGTREVL